MKNISPIDSISIVIPLYNEANTIYQLLDNVCSVRIEAVKAVQIIVVNDCSTDGSIDRVNEFINDHPDDDITLIQNSENRGKGYSLRQGFKHASGDYILIQDADLEYDPRDYNDLFEPIRLGQADVVYGSRFRGSKPHRMLFFWHSAGNKILTFLCNVVANLNLTDMECCYKIIRRDILNQIDLKEDRFGFEPEVTIKLSRHPDIRIYEVGVAYYGRTYAQGKKINYKDGFRAVYCIMKYAFSRTVSI